MKKDWFTIEGNRKIKLHTFQFIEMIVYNDKSSSLSSNINIPDNLQSKVTEKKGCSYFIVQNISGLLSTLIVLRRIFHSK